MKIDRTNFTGIDARPLNSIILRDISANKQFEKVVKELTQIGDKEGFEVLVQDAKRIVTGGEYSRLESLPLPNKQPYPWPQDNLTFTPDGQLMANPTIKNLNAQISKETNRSLKNNRMHNAGGNIYYVKDTDGDSLIIGKDEMFFIATPSGKTSFNIKRLYPISQPDFHIDLGIRPLANKVVLVNDEKITINMIKQAIQKSKTIAQTTKDAAMANVCNMLKMIYETFKEQISANAYDKRNNIAKELTEYGFKVVKVPSNIYYNSPMKVGLNENSYLSNFMNAIVHVNKDGDLIYITNKSSLDFITEITPEIEAKLGFSFHKMFKDALKGLVKEENIHFIDGNGYISNTLELSQGGIHCMCAEVPAV